MMHTMTASGPAFGGYGFAAFAALHVLGMTAVTLGILFFIFYVYKTFTHTQLKTWAIWLTIGGIIVCAMTLGSIGMHRNKGMMGGTNATCGMMRMGMMDDDDDSSQGGMMMKDGMDMSMNGMTTMLKGKTGDDFDEAFLEMMVPHHQGAIDMAKLALENAKHDELKNMARGIMNAQQREIDEMNAWMKSWGYTK